MFGKGRFFIKGGLTILHCQLHYLGMKTLVLFTVGVVSLTTVSWGQLSLGGGLKMGASAPAIVPGGGASLSPEVLARLRSHSVKLTEGLSFSAGRWVVP